MICFKAKNINDKKRYQRNIYDEKLCQKTFTTRSYIKKIYDKKLYKKTFMKMKNITKIISKYP